MVLAHRGASGYAPDHTLAALRLAIEQGADAIEADVADAWEVLAEAVQTVMRRYGIPEPYEKLKALTRGEAVTKDILQDFIGTLEIPEDEKQRLLALTPSTYVGLAAELAKDC